MEGESNILEVVWEPVAGKIDIDIVFVHGLGVTWRQTWAGEHDSRLWLRDTLPKDFPTARILTWVYDANIIPVSLETPSINFRQCLEKHMGTADITSPIMFVAHSLGGILVQDALLREADLRNSSLLKRTKGVIFMGTPRFKQQEEWRRFEKSTHQLTKASQIEKARDFAYYMQINEDFETWLMTVSSDIIDTWCFYETLSMHLMGVLVPKESAIINTKNSSPLIADHLSLAKFESSEDPRYESFCERLDLMSGGLQVVKFEPTIKRAESQDNREMIFEFFDQHDKARKDTILGLALEDRGHSLRAEQIYTKVIESRKHSQNTMDEVVLFFESKISSLLRGRGSYPQAELRCQQVYDSEVATFGKGHNLTLQTAGHLALTCRDRGKFEEAFLIIRNNLEMEAKSPYQHIAHVRLASILTDLLKDHGYHDLSLFLARNIVAASGKILGQEHAFTLDLATRFALILAETGQVRLAEEVSSQALDGIEKALGTRHPDALKAATRFAYILRQRGRSEAAIELFERTLKAQEAQLDFRHPDMIMTRFGLAGSYALDLRLDEAEFFLEEVMTQQADLLGDNHPDIRRTERALYCVRESQRDLTDHSAPGVDATHPSKQLLLVFSRPSPSTWHDMDAIEVGAVVQQEAKRQASEGVIHDKVRSNGPIDFLKDSSQRSQDHPVGGICGTPLHTACFAGDEKKVKELLSQSASDLNTRGGIFETTLHAAAFAGHMGCVNLLLESNAEPNINCDFGRTALQTALSMNHREVVKLLLAKGADPNVLDFRYGTPLHEASMAGHNDMVKLLLNAGARVDRIAGHFGTALAAAAWNGNPVVVQTLLDHGARINISFRGKTPLYQAVAGGHKEVLAMLLAKEMNNGSTSVQKLDPMAKENSGPKPAQIEVEMRKTASNTSSRQPPRRKKRTNWTLLARKLKRLPRDIGC